MHIRLPTAQPVEHWAPQAWLAAAATSPSASAASTYRRFISRDLLFAILICDPSRVTGRGVWRCRFRADRLRRRSAVVATGCVLHAGRQRHSGVMRRAAMAHRIDRRHAARLERGRGRTRVTTIRVDDRESGVRLLTLDRPPANALDEQLLGDLDAVLAAAADDDRVRAVVVTGAGAFFSAGFDLSSPRRDEATARRLRALYRDSHLRLLLLPKPTVAMIAGHAIAGGLVLALACDYRLALDGEYRVGLN